MTVQDTTVGWAMMRTAGDGIEVVALTRTAETVEPATITGDPITAAAATVAGPGGIVGRVMLVDPKTVVGVTTDPA